MIEPASYSSEVQIETVTLEVYLQRKSIQNVKLLKLEAEGFEPEILQGTKGVFPKIQYIAVDGGEERGSDEKETLSAICNILFGHGFKMIGVDIKRGWGRALFFNPDHN